MQAPKSNQVINALHANMHVRHAHRLLKSSSQPPSSPTAMMSSSFLLEYPITLPPSWTSSVMSITCKNKNRRSISMRHIRQIYKAVRVIVICHAAHQTDQLVCVCLRQKKPPRSVLIRPLSVASGCFRLFAISEGWPRYYDGHTHKRSESQGTSDLHMNCAWALFLRICARLRVKSGFMTCTRTKGICACIPSVITFLPCALACFPL